MEHNEPRQERSPAPRDHTQRRRMDAQRRPDRQRPDRSRQKRSAESNPAREAGTARAKRPDRQRPRSADRRAPRPEGQTVEHRRSTRPVQRQARRPAKKPAYGRLFDHRFRVRLITTLALAAAMILCFIVFFRVNTISVTGNEKYTQQEVLDASGIEKGDALRGGDAPADEQYYVSDSEQQFLQYAEMFLRGQVQGRVQRIDIESY